jgi:hypothetical protein
MLPEKMKRAVIPVDKPTMSTALILLTLVAGGHPLADGCPTHGPAVKQSMGGWMHSRAMYHYWACHPAYYLQWPNYDYRREFDYPWFAHPRPSYWNPWCDSPTVDLPIWPPEDGFLPPSHAPLGSHSTRPPLVTRIGKAGPSTTR